MKNRKVFFFTGTLVFVSFIMAAFISIRSMDTIVDKYQKELTVSIMSQIYNDIGIELSNPINVAQVMSSDYFVKQYLENPDFPETEEQEENIINYLKDIQDGLNYNTAFVISNKNGKYYTMNGYNKTVDPVNDAHDIWYEIFVNSGLEYDFEVDIDEVHNNEWSVFVNARIENDNHELLGVCGVAVDMTYLQKSLQKFESAYNIKVNLVDQNGLIQVDTDTVNIENAILENAVATFDKSHDFNYQKTENGYVCSTYIDSFDWYLVVTCEDDKNYAYADMFTKLTVAFLGILIVLLICIFIIIRIDRKELIKVSITDGLTGLYNKQAFMDEAMKQAKLAANVPYSFIFIDLDRFKNINDDLGHSTGDLAIVKMSEILKRVFGEQELIGRFGGDEFVVFLKNTPEKKLIARLEELNSEARVTFGNGNTSVDISASIGAVLCNEKPSDDFTKLMNQADEELYKSKENGRDQYHLSYYKN